MPALTCRVRGDLTLPADLHPRLFDALRNELSLVNPEWSKARREGKPFIDIPHYLRFVREESDGTHLPRGAASIVKRICQEDGYDFRWQDERSLGEPLGLKLDFEPRYYQSEAVELLARKQQGLVVLPCAAGKTFLGYTAIRAIGRHAIVLVHTLDLLRQWAKDLQEHSGIVAGIVADGVREHREVTIASVYSLGDEDWKIIDRYGLVVHDEAHHVPAATHYEVARHIPAKYRLALTATPDRDDDLGGVIEWVYGPKLYEKETAELASQGFIALPNVMVVRSGVHFGYRIAQDRPERIPENDPNVIEQRLVEHKGRNGLLVDLSKTCLQTGTVLLLVKRHEHCAVLDRLLEERGLPHAVMTGSSGPRAWSSKKHRQAVVERMKGGEAFIVIATSVFDEGINVPILQHLIIGSPSRSTIKTVQRAGRLMRPSGSPTIYDVVDAHEQLQNRWDNRRRTYKRLGLPIAESHWAP